MDGKIIAKKLHQYEDGILGAINNTEIAAAMAAYGYNAARMQEGKALVEKANRLMAEHVKTYGQQYEATSVSNRLFEKAYADYMVMLKVTRVAFKGNSAFLNQINATGKRRKSLSGWMRDARILYTNLLSDPNALATIERFNINAERLTNELQQVNQVGEAHSKGQEGKGLAQQGTVDRDKAFDELADWYSDFRAIARIALYEKPQLLEALGIIKK